MSTPLSYKSETIPALSNLQVNVTGKLLYVKAATQQFRIRVDDGDEFPIDAGAILRFPFTFRKLLLVNPNATADAVQFYTGDAIVDFVGSEQVRNRGSDLKPSGIIEIAGGSAYETFLGTWLGRQRKQIIVTCLDANNPVYVGAVTGSALAPCYPTRPWTVETDSDLRVYNLSNDVIQVSVAEFFYR